VEDRIWVKEIFLSCNPFLSLLLKVFKSTANSEQCRSEIFLFAFACLYFFQFSFLSCLLKVEVMILEKEYVIKEGGS